MVRELLLKRVMTRRLLFFTTLVLMGCAATGPTFQPAPAPTAEQALLYIYRPESAALSARSASIQIDSVTVANLSNNGYTVVYVKPGRLKISQHYPALLGVFGGGKTEEPLEILVDVRAGDRQYIEVSPRNTTTRQGSTSTIHFVWTLAQRSEREALTPLAACKYQAPLLQ